MSNFEHGRKLKTYKDKVGDEILLRYPMDSDLHELHRYINKLSTEDTYITFSGEQISLEEEHSYLDSILINIENKDSIHLLAYDKEKLIGVVDSRRDFSKKNRALHITIIGLTVDIDYRGRGIGKELLVSVLDETKKNLEGIRSAILHVFGTNEKAISLYKSLGFVEVGRIKSGTLHKGEYIDEVTMQLNLVEN